MADEPCWSSPYPVVAACLTPDRPAACFNFRHSPAPPCTTMLKVAKSYRDAVDMNDLRVDLVGKRSAMLTQFLKISGESAEKAAMAIRKGGLVVYPTDTVYGLGCN